jgi:hypothetical protein
MSKRERLSSRQLSCLREISRLRVNFPVLRKLREAGFKTNTISSLISRGLVHVTEAELYLLTPAGIAALRDSVTVSYVPDSRLSRTDLSRSRRSDLYAEELFKAAVAVCHAVATEGTGFVAPTMLKVVLANTLAPHGWEFLGSGVSRIAFRGPDGWVYKLAKGTNSQSYDEHALVRHFRGQWWAPESSRLHVFEISGGIPGVDDIWWRMTVLRMPYYARGERRLSMAAHRALDEVSEKHGLLDIHDGNVVPLADDTFKIIDLGCERLPAGVDVASPAPRKVYADALIGS